VLQNNSGAIAVWDMSGSTVSQSGVIANPGPTDMERHWRGSPHWLFYSVSLIGARGDANRAGRVGVHQLRPERIRSLGYPVQDMTEPPLAQFAEGDLKQSPGFAD
jgi:hypothetical protein